jgi:hypothetical protein
LVAWSTPLAGDLENDGNAAAAEADGAVGDVDRWLSQPAMTAAARMALAIKGLRQLIG